MANTLFNTTTLWPFMSWGYKHNTGYFYMPSFLKNHIQTQEVKAFLGIISNL